MVKTLTYLRVVLGRGGSGGGGVRTYHASVHFRSSEALRLRLVIFHLAAADLEAAAVVGLAVHIVQALAAYERGVEGLVYRQAHRLTVWEAFLQRR